MIKSYIVLQNGILGIVKANHRPVGFVTDKIEAGINDVDFLDIIDDIDPITLEVIGKKAVLNVVKRDAKLAAQALKDAANQTRQDASAANRISLKAALPTFDTMAAADKWLLVKKLIEEL